MSHIDIKKKSVVIKIELGSARMRHKATKTTVDKAWLYIKIWLKQNEYLSIQEQE